MNALLLRATAAVLVAAGTETAAPSRSPAQSIAFTRLDTGRLEGLEPGTALIRDSVAWRTLWWSFGREYRSEWNAPLPDSVATPPPADFRRNVIVAMSSRVFRGCGAPYISPIVPLVRLLFPSDTGQSVVPASDSTVRFYRTLMRVTFYDTTGGDQVRSALEHWHAAIVAGGPYPTPYILRLPDPGSTSSAFDSLLGALRDTPGVQDAFPVIVRERRSS